MERVFMSILLVLYGTAVGAYDEGNHTVLAGERYATGSPNKILHTFEPAGQNAGRTSDIMELAPIEFWDDIKYFIGDTDCGWSIRPSMIELRLTLQGGAIKECEY